MFPGIAQVHVEADGHHEAAFVIVNTAKMGFDAAVFVCAAALKVLRARDLETLIEIKDRVEDGVRTGDFDDRPIRKHSLHTLDEDAPFFLTVKIITHEESAAQQV